MANPSIWAPGTAVSANASIRVERFVATAGQTVFTLSQFAYAIGAGSLYVFVNGGFQVTSVDFTETDSSSFTLTEGVTEGTIVVAVGFIEIAGGSTVVDAAVIAAEAALAAAEQAVIDAQAAKAAAETAAAALPNAPAAGVDKYIKTNETADGFIYNSAEQVLADIGAEPADATILKDADIGMSVQAYDADTAKTDQDQSWTGSPRATPVTDNDGSFDMNAGLDFLCTPTAGFTLTFTNIAQGQRGSIYLVNGSNYAIAAAATTKVTTSLLAAISATGEYWLSYWSPDGTNVLVTHAGDFA